MKILIFGMGQVGTQLHDYFLSRGHEVVGLTSATDIRDAVAVDQAIVQHAPDVVVNAVAKANLEWCEDNKLDAFAVNTLGAENIGKSCAVRGIYFVHISSGCIQESLSREDMRREEDRPNPLSYYSWTKVWAEELVQSLAERKNLQTLILRPRQLLSATPNRYNALVKMLTYKQFIDTPQSCTVVEDLLAVTHELVLRRATGVYNVANPGVTTPYEIALLLKELVDPNMEFMKIDKKILDAQMRSTRIDCVLSVEKLAGIGITLPPLESRLRKIIAALAANLKTQNIVMIMSAVQLDTANKLSGRV